MFSLKKKQKTTTWEQGIIEGYSDLEMSKLEKNQKEVGRIVLGSRVPIPLPELE